jgi:hypothetical protein
LGAQEKISGALARAGAGEQMKTSISGFFRPPQWNFAFWTQLLVGLLFFGIPAVAFSAADVTIATIQAAWRSREAKLNNIPFRAPKRIAQLQKPHADERSA